MDGNTSINISNYGTMGGIYTHYSNDPVKINVNNFGTINPAVGCYFSAVNGCNGVHFAFGSANVTLVIDKYLIKINQTKDAFTNYKNTGELDDKNSHLSIYYHTAPRTSQVSFKDAHSKLIIDFGEKFELGKEYPLDKLITDKNGDSASYLTADFSRLTLSDGRKDIYELLSNGDSFIIIPRKKITETPITAIYKANIRTMNNFYTMSNSMIYPHKKVGLNRAPTKKRVIRRAKKVSAFDSVNNPSLRDSIQSDSNAYLSSLRENERSEFSWQSINLNSYDSWIASSALLPRNDEFLALESLESHESFAYKNNSTDSTNRRKVSSNQTTKTTIPNANQNKSNYYFILTPFVNHNLFFESGRYNLSGFDYGFLSAFSGKLTANNSLGAHFMMSYGTLGDSSDKNFRISNLNLNLGLNYKLDLVWDMYLKARGDFFYFLNQVKTLTMMEAIKPNNLGFGLSVSYGKDFDFKQGGILGIEGGIDYKALSASEITLDSMSETYQKSLYHLLYLDLGISYAKYFGGFGFNAGLGIKGNVSANKLAKSKINLNALNRNVDMILDNDKILGYANLALSYVLNARNFDMEFSIAYYGNYGDRVISNGGGFEWRVGW